MSDEKTVNIVKEVELRTAIEEALTPRLAGVAKLSDVEAKVAEFSKSLKPKDTLNETAKMEEGILAGFAKTEFFGIEFGKIAIGTFGGVFVSELIDGFMATQNTTTKGITKLVIAGTVAQWGKRWVGVDAAKALALIIGVFGLSQVLPVDKWAVQLASQVKSILPGTIKVTGKNESRVVREATTVARDYYDQAMGR